MMYISLQFHLSGFGRTLSIYYSHRGRPKLIKLVWMLGVLAKIQASYFSISKIVLYGNSVTYIDGSRAVCRVGLNYSANLSK